MAGSRGGRGSYSNSNKRNNKDTDLNLSDMFSALSDALIKQAAEPNMHAYKPHEKQKIFHKSDKLGRLYIGGNRSGKTVGGIIEDLWYVTRRHPYRQIPSDVEIRGRVLGDGFDNGTINQVLIPAFKRWIVPSDLINGSWEDSWVEREKKLTLDNGSFIEFKSYDQEIQKHAGTSRHFIHFDEEPPQNIYIESLLRIIDTQGSWWMTMTPLNGMNWVYDEIYMPGIEGSLPNVEVIEVNTLDNPHITESAIEGLLTGISEEEREQRIEGKFAEKGGLVFPEFGESHLLGSEWDNWWPDYDWRIYMSIDHGINNPTAVYWHAVSKDNQVITFGEHYQRNMIVKDHAKIIHEFEQLHNLAVWLRPGDPAMKQRNGVTGTSIVEAYSEEGIFLNVDTIPRAVSTGIDRMRTYMRMGPDGKTPSWRIIKSRCPNLVKEMGRLHWKVYSSSKLNDSQNRIDEVHKKDDHAFDSCRYFFTLMPDLTPDKLWHMEENTSSRTVPLLKSYYEVLTEMNAMSLEKAWKPSYSGFAPEEYSFANLEG